MNGNSDNHKPLSPEELFRLLESKREEALSGNELDDFEREALEGFSAHTSAERAKELTEEVHQRIHRQLDETRKKRPAGRIIWLGAAASLVLGLIISAYIITQNAKFSNELALNKEEAAKRPGYVPATPVPEETGNGIAAGAKKQEAEARLPERENLATALQPQKEVSGQEIYTVPKDEASGRSERKVAADATLEQSKDKSKSGQAQADSDYDLRTAGTPAQADQKAGYVANGVAATDKALAAPKKEDLAAMAPAAEKAQMESEGVVDANRRDAPVGKSNYAFKKGKTAEESSATSPAVTASGSARTEDYKNAPGNLGAAYYTGGNQELKAEIVAWFKEHRYEAPKGNYKVRMKVKADGTAQVLELKAERNADAKAISNLEECLKALKNWNPAMNKQEASESETAFSLSF